MVVGHSMGGVVANQLAAKRKDRVRGVVGIGPSHPTPAFGVNMNKRIATVNECGLPFFFFEAVFSRFPSFPVTTFLSCILFI